MDEKYEIQEVKHRIDLVEHHLDDIKKDVKLVDQRNTEQHDVITGVGRETLRNQEHMKDLMRVNEDKLTRILWIVMLVPTVVAIVLKFI